VRTKRIPWSACPNCLADMKAKGMERKPQYLVECTFCAVSIVPIWWWSTLRSILALALALTIPAYLGLGNGVTLIFLVVPFCFPALVFAQFLLITVIPPKYVRKGQSVTTIF